MGMVRSERKRIGILGGSFDPIHIGHLIVAQMTLETMQLDKVIFIPVSISPHKNIKKRIMSSPIDRYQMVKLAIKGHPFFEISDYEVKKGGISYSIDTALHLRNLYQDSADFIYIIGEDLVNHLENWRQIDDLVKIVRFAVIHRPGIKKKNRVFSYDDVSVPGIDISSSFIRKRVREGKSIDYFVPSMVAQYVYKMKLYL